MSKTQAALKKCRAQNKKLYRQNTNLRKMNTKLHVRQRVLYTRLDKSQHLRDNIQADLPPAPAALIKVLLSKKKINWTLQKEAMDLCLSIFFRSTSAYSVLRSSGFLLPHPTTLRRQYSKVMRSVGICPVLMDMLKICALTLQDHEKCITLALDGMTLTQAFEYNKNSDEVSGFVNCGKYGQSPTVANQGILLMVRGLTLKWKQIIGFFISKHNLNTSVLGQIISDAVSELKQIGFYVDGIVMDQESSQWKWVWK